MSLLWQLKKVFDPTKQKEEDEDLKNNRVDNPLGLAEGDGDDVELPETGPSSWECPHCGFTSTEKNYCSDCLVFMEERN